VRIGDAVQHQHEGRQRLRRQQIEQGILVERRARANFGDDALVGCAAGFLVEGRRRRLDRAQSPRRRNLAQLAHANIVARGGDGQPLHVAGPARQHSAHGVQSVDERAVHLCRAGGLPVRRRGWW
jgi:hypothetical protein